MPPIAVVFFSFVKRVAGSEPGVRWKAGCHEAPLVELVPLAASSEG